MPVNTPTAGGLRLSGALRMPESGAERQLELDAAILLSGVGSDSNPHPVNESCGMSGLSI